MFACPTTSQHQCVLQSPHCCYHYDFFIMPHVKPLTSTEKEEGRLLKANEESQKNSLTLGFKFMVCGSSGKKVYYCNWNKTRQHHAMCICLSLARLLTEQKHDNVTAMQCLFYGIIDKCGIHTCNLCICYCYISNICHHINSLYLL